MATDFTIVIAHRGNAMGLWATIQSCEIDLARSDFKYNYIIIENGTKKMDADVHNIGFCLGKTPKLKQWITHPENMSPPSARQMGTIFADGEILFFFDNHCLVERDYFARAMMDFKKYPIDLLHSATRFYEGDNVCYEYKLRLDKNFWGESKTVPQESHKPYLIAAGGHGGFAIRRSVWNEMGGYWTGFKGYGGEEMYFDLLMWQRGYQCWLDPLVVHHHFAGQRGYSRHYTDEFYINMMACANLIGGSQWMNKLCVNFERNYIKTSSGRDMFDLMMVAQDRSQAHADYLTTTRKMDLDQLLAFFREKQISH